MKSFVWFFRFFCFLSLNGLMASCSGSSGNGGSSNSSTPPVAYCSTQTSYTNPITLTGQAVYEYRTNGNGAIATPKPIRHAEIRVTNAQGSIIQCGETDSSGNFSLSLPANGQSATITIASRADNNFIKAYILTDPTTNGFHSVSSTTTLDGTKSLGTLTAIATGEIPGGAFNILDKILEANDFLRTETANCQATFSNCTPFSVAPLVNTYWAAGVDPGTYFNIPSLSFYIPSQNQLYILGGVNGDVDNSDTDHFDDSIVIHEYAHFLEHTYSISDSPGGSHNGDNILDPRLAWGEAWANYFQAAVTGNPVYRDTFGTPEGISGVFVNENLESGSADTPTTSGEGNFREFAITRALVDLTDANEMNASDDIQTSFAELWTLLTATNGGFADPNQNFRSLGLFFQLQAALTGGSNWSTIQTAGQFVTDRRNYANTLSSGSSCPTAIQAANVPGASIFNNPGRQPEDGSFVNSNQFQSNDFYQISHGGGNLQIDMSYTTTPSNAANLDIYLYQNQYFFGIDDPSNILGRSVDVIAGGASGDTESLSVAALPAGTYMLNILYNTNGGIKSSASYSLTLNGQSVCPD